ncbi:MAG: hypothetical protein ABJN62_12920 [Halioglobus sp.]
MSNVQKLIDANIIPQGYDKLSDEETATINSMSADEVDAVISASAKVYDIMEKHQPHGMAY